MSKSVMSKSVMLCDDDAYILRAVEIKFKHAGYGVCCVSDGLEAWETLQQKSVPDILITDCQMPRMDGVELVGKIHADPVLTHMPMVLLTAKGYELSHDQLREHGVFAVIAKPFSPRQLVERVEQILQQTIVV